MGASEVDPPAVDAATREARIRLANEHRDDVSRRRRILNVVRVPVVGWSRSLGRTLKKSSLKNEPKTHPRGFLLFRRTT